MFVMVVALALVFVWYWGCSWWRWWCDVGVDSGVGGRVGDGV